MHSILHAFTHSVVWASIIASAVVAAVVTLIIEYLAKPGLEARKERILEKSRQRRTALANFRRAINLAIRVLPFKDQPPEIVSLMAEHIKGIMTDVQPYMLDAGENILAPQSVSREWGYTVSSMYARMTVYSVVLPTLPDGFWEGLEEDTKQMENFYRLFTTSRWRPFRRRKLIRKIEASPAPSTFISAKERHSLPSSNQETTGLCP